MAAVAAATDPDAALGVAVAAAVVLDSVFKGAGAFAGPADILGRLGAAAMRTVPSDKTVPGAPFIDPSFGSRT